ncbi:hypothetical protein JVT61DRAFT_10796 [Boletus reticuloceps]|uniref:Uncharacterized protein n=1 Tax=Boletus reticuloceps TaxID=495285 RepID=A0A8I2YFE5_9AGAM|nr:hypothetical protein JVT61DRAFT_10796 [Boletus reticuloceps]
MSTNAAGEEPSSRPKRALYPLARLRDTKNAATPELRSHQHVKLADESPLPFNHESPPPRLPSAAHKRKRAPMADDEVELSESGASTQPSSHPRLTKGKRLADVRTAERTSRGLNASGADCTAPATSTQPLQDASAPDGPSKDVTMIDIDEQSTARHEQCSRNVDQFFDEPFAQESNGKKCRKFAMSQKAYHSRCGGVNFTAPLGS